MNSLMLKACLMASVFTAAIAIEAVAQDQIVVGNRARVTVSADDYKTFKPGKTAHGAPDLEGVWTNASLTTFTRPAQYSALVLTEEEARKAEHGNDQFLAERNKATNPNATVNDLDKDCGRGFSGTSCGYDNAWTDPGETVMRVRGEPRSSFLTTADGKVPPRRTGAPAPAGRGALRAGVSQNDNPETRSLGERCIMSFGQSSGPVMLPQLYNSNYKIVQGKDTVAILVEMVHDTRVVRLNASHRTDGVRPWMGDSIGRYEGDTLVVETTNFPRSQAFNGSWENLKITEKFTRVAKNRLLYQFTVEDPTVWDKPWGGEYEFGSTAGEIYEYACHEGNYALEGILAGARAEEEGAKAGAKPVAAR